ncbi:hypothetical protein NC653_023385 [Populus alba x Populus x berolinensis]|uniref:Uncharacterized protein n=1 Tax=Populus alba x Populus x berolinensis TaxID=444605 RepID=A0AAD6MIH5_9ROSI|nr:hypothetical protein NC653_023385 [Populus alba x Populus x berolinensis]
MVIQRLEMCIALVKLAMEFFMAVVEAIGIVIQRNGTAAPLANHHYIAPKVEARTRDLQETLSCQLSYMLDDFDGSVS